MKIASLHARQVLDSRGFPTVETEISLDDGSLGRAIVPSGASTGQHEALELRDNDADHYQGKSVIKAIQNIENILKDELINNEFDQRSLDEAMLIIDGTNNKSRLGANAILAVSLAFSHATAKFLKKPLYEYFHSLSGFDSPIILPVPLVNIINGGKHGNWGADFQEFMILPIGATSFSEAIEMSSNTFHTLGKVLKEKGYSTLVGDEGGYAPVLKLGNAEAFELILEAIEKAGYKPGQEIILGIDVAASEFYKTREEIYSLKSERKELTTDEMIAYFSELCEKYPIKSIEDGLEQNSWEGWARLTEKLGNNTQIVGDDLFVTNTSFLKKGIEKKAGNTILIKLNQIGTVTETIKATNMAQKAGWKAIISHRSGETEDVTIAHLAVGLGTGEIKTGSLSRTERVAKYNELLRIEEELGKKAVYAGTEEQWQS